MFKKSPFHKVDKSIWPVLVSFTVLGLLLNLVLYFHHLQNVWFVYKFLFLVVLVSFSWWAEVMKESAKGFHNSFVISKFYVGMIILMISEIFFFVSFFWAFFHKCWVPNIEMGSIWPPFGMEAVMVDCFSIPLLNTIILLSSGVSVTWAHHSILKKKKVQAINGLVFTVILGLVFLFFQNFEYAKSLFAFNSTTYGSCFYMLTGFHGGHVMVGTMFLIVCLMRALISKFKNNRHVGLELAIWYWHFVDVVWLFLFIFIYWYTSLI